MISAAAYWASPEPPIPAGLWIAQTWNEPADPGLLWRHLLMPFAGVDLSLDRSAWSLVHEIRISLAFPLLWLTVARAPLVSLGAALALAVGGWRWTGCSDLGCLPCNGADTTASFGATAYFTVFFVLGILLARQRSVVIARIRRLSPFRRGAFWTAAIYGMIVPFKFHVLPDAPVGLSAVLLIALTLATPGLGAVLEMPSLQWLGRVSFSLYLIHLAILAAVMRWGWGEDRVLLLFLTLGISLVSADLLYRCIERPCVRFGHRLAGWLARASAGGAAKVAVARR